MKRIHGLEDDIKLFRELCAEVDLGLVKVYTEKRRSGYRTALKVNTGMNYHNRAVLNLVIKYFLKLAPDYEWEVCMYYPCSTTHGIYLEHQGSKEQ